MAVPLPRSAVLTLWMNAVLRGSVGPDDLASAVKADDPQHLVVDWPDQTRPLDLIALPGAVARLEDPVVSLALPAPGDPVGLAGPPSFNADAVETGEAVVVTGRQASLGLVPELDARTVMWRAQPAHRVPVLDTGEASRALRQTLLTATAELVRLDVAHWQPEIPDLLLNIANREGLHLPPGTPPQTVETLERAALCLEIVELARADHGGALTSYEIAARAGCLTDLDLAARRALVAFCSASLKAS